VRALAERLARLERQTAQQTRQQRCSTCRDWPTSCILITEVNADGIVTRQDKLEGQSTCPACGWGATIHTVEIEEVRDWNSIGRHGRR
jgi:hypothetical protein